MKYEATIGLEIHAELKTATKMFCCSKNDANETRPNVNICPVCLAHPGTLPVINGEAVKQVLRVGLAIGSRLADYTEFDRKNYFYPDLPKGYQLSQFEYPLVSGGELNGVAITRIHLEEDTASSIHDDATGETLIDYNRAGVPLMELVTEPVMKTAEQAGEFGRELQLLLRYLGVSDANMEKGEMRVEANVSVAPAGQRSSAYVEIKNLNSFRIMEKAVAYEIKRQEAMLEKGEKLVKQTLGWDDKKQATFPQRTKEGSADYRYFPDPDLPSMKLSELPEYSTDALKATMPELPADRRNRYKDLGVKHDDAHFFTADERFGKFFDAVLQVLGDDVKMIELASNYLANDLVKIIRDIEERETEMLKEIPISVDYFKALMEMIFTSKVSSRSGKDILLTSVEEKKHPHDIAKEKNLFQNTNTGDLEKVIDSVIAGNAQVVADYKGGKASALEYLVGQCMKTLRGAANAATLREMIAKKLL